jgi:hypothetical protein
MIGIAKEKSGQTDKLIDFNFKKLERPRVSIQ